LLRPTRAQQLTTLQSLVPRNAAVSGVTDGAVDGHPPGVPPRRLLHVDLEVALGVEGLPAVGVGVEFGAVELSDVGIPDAVACFGDGAGGGCRCIARSCGCGCGCGCGWWGGGGRGRGGGGRGGRGSGGGGGRVSLAVCHRSQPARLASCQLGMLLEVFTVLVLFFEASAEPEGGKPCRALRALSRVDSGSRGLGRGCGGRGGCVSLAVCHRSQRTRLASCQLGMLLEVFTVLVLFFEASAEPEGRKPCRALRALSRVDSSSHTLRRSVCT